MAARALVHSPLLQSHDAEKQPAVQELMLAESNAKSCAATGQIERSQSLRASSPAPLKRSVQSPSSLPNILGVMTR